MSAQFPEFAETKTNMFFSGLFETDIIEDAKDKAHVDMETLFLMSIQLEINIVVMYGTPNDTLSSKTAIFKAPLKDIEKECIEKSVDDGNFKFDGTNWDQIWGPQNNEITIRMVLYRFEMNH